jgi:hypothetical protein
MIDKKPTRYKLQAEDADRMRRLSEEVRGRLLEMALITSRTVGLELGSSAVVKFVPHKRTKLVAGGDWMEIVDVDGVEACYGVIDGQAFAESPCGG